jgi:hypothetical protein
VCRASDLRAVLFMVDTRRADVDISTRRSDRNMIHAFSSSMFYGRTSALLIASEQTNAPADGDVVRQ